MPETHFDSSRREGGEIDPFEAFNRAQGAGSMRDPYPWFGELRRQGGVVKVKVRELMGTSSAMEIPEELEIYSAVSHDAVSEILRDASRFSSSSYGLTMGLFMGRTILEMDPPEHTAHRGLIQQAFTRKALERWETELVGPVVGAFIDRFASRGRADLVRELTFPFPVTVIAEMMGLPESDHPTFHRLAVELISGSFDFKRAVVASDALRELFARVLAERRAEPRDDLISMLAAAELEDGTRLDDEAIFGFLRLLAPAGAETTYRSSSNLLCGLLTHPEQLEALRNDRDLMTRAIDEGLRWECPLTGIMRMATADTEVAGVAIPDGAMIHVNVGAANRDPGRYERPDEFDLFRKARQHIAFATGPHACLGMHLARMETRVVIDALFDRLRNLRIDPEGADVHVTGLMFRSPLALPVVFDPA